MQDLLQRGTKYTALPAKFAFLSAGYAAQLPQHPPLISPPSLLLDCSDNTIIFAALSVIGLPKKKLQTYQFTLSVFL